MKRLADELGIFLTQCAFEDHRIWAIDADLADCDGACHFAEAHTDRFVMAGIAEQSAVSLAAGLAACGCTPFVFSFAAFLCYRAYDQIRVNISQTGLPVVLVGSHAGGCSGRNGKTHSSLNDLALMTSLPGFNVWSPGDGMDVRLAVKGALQKSGPTYIRLPRDPLPELGGVASQVRVFSPGSRVLIVSHGIATHVARQAAEILLVSGFRTTVVHCPQIRPLPIEALQTLRDGVESIFVVEDHYEAGGLGAALRHKMNIKIAAWFGWPADWPGKSGASEELRAMNGWSAAQVAEAIRATCGDIF